MAKTTRARAKQPDNPFPNKTCRDCAHSYDWHNRSFHDGHYILCRCIHDSKSQHGKFCKFLSDAACITFKQRQ